MTNIGKKKWFLLAGAAALFLILLSVFFIGVNKTPGSYIAIDINPGIELQTDRFDRVTSIHATNEDAERVLAGLSLEGAPLEDAVEDIIDRVVTLGYLGGDQENDILLTVSGGDKPQALLERVNTAIQSILEGKQVEARIHAQGLASVDDLLQQAQQAGVSAGKYAVIQKILLEDPTVTAQELADVRVSELFAYAREKHISFFDVLDEFEDAVEDTLLNPRSAPTASTQPGSSAPVGDKAPESSSASTSSAAVSSAPSPSSQQLPTEDDYCDYCGKPESVCRNRCKQYCDDCGKLLSQCQGHHDDGPEYCDFCGRLESECRDSCKQYCDDCGKPLSQCQGRHHDRDDHHDDWDDDGDDDRDYCEGCGQLESVCREQCGAYLYCEDCGKLKTECQDRCDVDGPDYCEACGQLESVCRDSCFGHRYCDDCGKLKTECQGRCDD